MASVLKQAGYRVGIYTSPHLNSYTERYAIDGEPISEALFEEFQARIQACEGVERLTEFERLTAMAFFLFREAQLDFVILEVGLGGRLDATNVVTPILSVITTIGLDHQAILGDSIVKIASEKAGIIHPGVPVITLDTQALEVMAVIQERAHALGSPISAVSPLRDIPSHYQMQGDYQRANIALATAALRALPVSLSDEQLHEGLALAMIWGRCTTLGTDPGCQVLADAAHNVDGVQALIAHLNCQYPTVRPTFIVGFYGPKDGLAMLRLLLTYGDVYYCEFDETAWSFAELVGMAGENYLRPFSLDDAGNWPRSPLVVLTGSIYFLGKLKTVLEKKGVL
jgi:dihydrofolate synthase / folylpolyglutamate synthase